MQTDGTLGSLAALNIVDWNLVLDDGIGTFNLLGPFSGNNSQLQISGNSYVATGTDIYFDFSNPFGDYALFQNPSIGSSINFWCIEGDLGGCVGSNNAETLRLMDAVQDTFQTGVVSVATVVPEPSAAALLLAGVAMIGFRKRSFCDTAAKLFRGNIG
jgi:hypothetical protein